MASGRKLGRTNARNVIWFVHWTLAALVAAYLIWLIVRPVGEYSELIDGWMVDGFEVVVSCLAIGRALVRQSGRIAPLVLGAAVLSWSIGDVVLTFESLGGASPSVPSLADLFYVGFYPCAYIALVLLLRRESVTLIPTTWLDGAVAGLGAAAVCGAFAFGDILRLAGGGTAAVVTNLVYPMGDLLLLALVVGGTALMAGKRKGPWLMVAAGFAINAVGDGFNLFGSSAGSSKVGVIFNTIAWPISILLISSAVWMRRQPSNPLAAQKATSFVMPGLGAFAGLAILIYGTFHHIDSVALVLASGTLLVVGLRLALSVTSLRTITEERHRQAVTDELTGLANRRQLAQVIDTFFSEGADTTTTVRRLSFLFVDLNHFKEVNDSFGHPAGDELLRLLGPRMKECVRDQDLVVRLGGDELAVVLLDADADFATTVAARLVAKLEEPFVIGMVKVRISASIGIAIAPEHANDGDALLGCADAAMYRSKSARSAYEVYDHLLDNKVDRLLLMDELRTAITQRELELNYQPQVDLRTGEILAVEALLRWNHPRLGNIAPLDFLPLAEEAGLMASLTALVVDSALGQCAVWRAEGRHFSVAVNVSATNILDDGFLDMIKHQLVRHRLPANVLVVEITETTIIGDFERCKMAIEALRSHGCEVSIDDFGAGFTSLAYLGSLLVNEIKLDRAFLGGLELARNERSVALVGATVELAHALGLRVVAEGVEDVETLDLLARLGCDLAQGYYIGRPSPPKDMVVSLPSGPYATSPPVVARRSRRVPKKRRNLS